MFLSGHQDIWDWKEYNFRCWYLVFNVVGWVLFSLVCSSLVLRRVWCQLVAFRKTLWDVDRWDHWRFQEKYVSGCWDLRFRNGGDGAGVMVLHKREEIWVFHQDLLSKSPGNGRWEWGEGRAESSEWDWRMNLEERREKWESILSLLASLGGVVCEFPGSTYWSWGLG